MVAILKRVFSVAFLAAWMANLNRTAGWAAMEGDSLAGQLVLSRGATASETVIDSVCLLIKSAALANGLPVSFFTRLIGQESSFRSASRGRSRETDSGPRASHSSCRRRRRNEAFSIPLILCRRFRVPPNS